MRGMVGVVVVVVSLLAGAAVANNCTNSSNTLLTSGESVDFLRKENIAAAREALAHQSASAVVKQLDRHMTRITKTMRNLREEVELEDPTVDVEPKERRHNNVVTAHYGEEITLRCVTEGADSIVWIKDRLAAPEGLPSARDELKLLMMPQGEDSPSKLYTGQYWCMATNTFHAKFSEPVALVVEGDRNAKESVEDLDMVDDEIEDMYQLKNCLEAMNSHYQFLYDEEYDVPQPCYNAIQLCASIQDQLCHKEEKRKAAEEGDVISAQHASDLLDERCLANSLKCKYLVRDCYVQTPTNQNHFDFCFFARLTTLYELPASSDSRLRNLEFSLGDDFHQMEGFQSKRHAYTLVLLPSEGDVVFRVESPPGARVVAKIRDEHQSTDLTSTKTTRPLAVKPGTTVRVDFTCTAANGDDSETYTVQVERGSAARNLNIVSLTIEPIEFTFLEDITVYEGLELDAMVDTVTVRVNGEAPLNGELSVRPNYDARLRTAHNSLDVPVIPGPNRLIVQVLGVDDESERYVFEIVRKYELVTSYILGHAKPFLSSLAVFGLDLQPIEFGVSFDPEWPLYRLHVASDVGHVRVKGDLDDTNVGLVVAGCATLPNTHTSPIPIMPGNNRIDVRLRTFDGTQSWKYSIDILRDEPIGPPSRDTGLAVLQYLEPGGITVRLDVEGDTEASIDVDPDVDRVYVLATTHHASAFLEIDGNAQYNGHKLESDTDDMLNNKPVMPVRLMHGRNPITVHVTAPDSITSRKWTLVFNRGFVATESLNVRVNAIFVGGGTPIMPYLERRFQKASVWDTGHSRFKATVAGNTEYVLVDVVPTYRKAAVEVNGRAVVPGSLSFPVPFPLGTTFLTLPLKIYGGAGERENDLQLIVFRASSDTSLVSWTLQPGVVEHVVSRDPIFHPDHSQVVDVLSSDRDAHNAVREVHLPHGYNVFTMQAEAKDKDSTISLSPAGGEAVAVERGRLVSVVVTSEDRTATKTYQAYVLPPLHVDADEPGCHGLYHSQDVARTEFGLFSEQDGAQWRRYLLDGLTAIAPDERKTQLNRYLSHVMSQNLVLSGVRGHVLVPFSWAGLRVVNMMSWHLRDCTPGTHIVRVAMSCLRTSPDTPLTTSVCLWHNNVPVRCVDQTDTHCSDSVHAMASVVALGVEMELGLEESNRLDVVVKTDWKYLALHHLDVQRCSSLPADGVNCNTEKTCAPGSVAADVCCVCGGGKPVVSHVLVDDSTTMSLALSSPLKTHSSRRASIGGATVVFSHPEVLAQRLWKNPSTPANADVAIKYTASDGAEVSLPPIGVHCIAPSPFGGRISTCPATRPTTANPDLPIHIDVKLAHSLPTSVYGASALEADVSRLSPTNDLDYVQPVVPMPAPCKVNELMLELSSFQRILALQFSCPVSPPLVTLTVEIRIGDKEFTSHLNPSQFAGLWPPTLEGASYAGKGDFVKFVSRDDKLNTAFARNDPSVMVLPIPGEVMEEAREHTDQSITVRLPDLHRTLRGVHGRLVSSISSRTLVHNPIIGDTVLGCFCQDVGSSGTSKQPATCRLAMEGYCKTLPSSLFKLPQHDSVRNIQREPESCGGEFGVFHEDSGVCIPVPVLLPPFTTRVLYGGFPLSHLQFDSQLHETFEKGTAVLLRDDGEFAAPLPLSECTAVGETKAMQCPVPAVPVTVAAQVLVYRTTLSRTVADKKIKIHSSHPLLVTRMRNSLGVAECRHKRTGATCGPDVHHFCLGTCVPRVLSNGLSAHPFALLNDDERVGFQCKPFVAEGANSAALQAVCDANDATSANRVFRRGLLRWSLDVPVCCAVRSLVADVAPGSQFVLRMHGPTWNNDASELWDRSYEIEIEEALPKLVFRTRPEACRVGRACRVGVAIGLDGNLNAHTRALVVTLAFMSAADAAKGDADLAVPVPCSANPVRLKAGEVAKFENVVLPVSGPVVLVASASSAEEAREQITVFEEGDDLCETSAHPRLPFSRVQFTPQCRVFVDTSAGSHLELVSVEGVAVSSLLQEVTRMCSQTDALDGFVRRLEAVLPLLGRGVSDKPMVQIGVRLGLHESREVWVVNTHDNHVQALQQWQATDKRRAHDNWHTIGQCAAGECPAGFSRQPGTCPPDRSDRCGCFKGDAMQPICDKCCKYDQGSCSVAPVEGRRSDLQIGVVLGADGDVRQELVKSTTPHWDAAKAHAIAASDPACAASPSSLDCARAKFVSYCTDGLRPFLRSLSTSAQAVLLDFPSDSALEMACLGSAVDTGSVKVAVVGGAGVAGTEPVVSVVHGLMVGGYDVRVGVPADHASIVGALFGASPRATLSTGLNRHEQLETAIGSRNLIRYRSRFAAHVIETDNFAVAGCVHVPKGSTGGSLFSNHLGEHPCVAVSVDGAASRLRLAYRVVTITDKTETVATKHVHSAKIPSRMLTSHFAFVLVTVHGSSAQFFVNGRSFGTVGLEGDVRTCGGEAAYVGVAGEHEKTTETLFDGSLHSVEVRLCDGCEAEQRARSCAATSNPVVELGRPAQQQQQALMPHFTHLPVPSFPFTLTTLVDNPVTRVLLANTNTERTCFSVRLVMDEPRSVVLTAFDGTPYALTFAQPLLPPLRLAVVGKTERSVSVVVNGMEGAGVPPAGIKLCEDWLVGADEGGWAVHRRALTHDDLASVSWLSGRDYSRIVLSSTAIASGAIRRAMSHTAQSSRVATDSISAIADSFTVTACVLLSPRDALSSEPRFLFSNTDPSGKTCLDWWVEDTRLVVDFGDVTVRSVGLARSSRCQPVALVVHSPVSMALLVNGRSANNFDLRRERPSRAGTCAGHVTVGARSDGSHQFDGVMGGVRVYDRPLTKCEVREVPCSVFVDPRDQTLVSLKVAHDAAQDTLALSHPGPEPRDLAVTIDPADSGHVVKFPTLDLWSVIQPTVSVELWMEKPVAGASFVLANSAQGRKLEVQIDGTTATIAATAERGEGANAHDLKSFTLDDLVVEDSEGDSEGDGDDGDAFVFATDEFRTGAHAVASGATGAHSEASAGATATATVDPDRPLHVVGTFCEGCPARVFVDGQLVGEGGFKEVGLNALAFEDLVATTKNMQGSYHLHLYDQALDPEAVLALFQLSRASRPPSLSWSG